MPYIPQKQSVVEYRVVNDLVLEGIHNLFVYIMDAVSVVNDPVWCIHICRKK